MEPKSVQEGSSADNLASLGAALISKAKELERDAATSLLQHNAGKAADQLYQAAELHRHYGQPIKAAMLYFDSFNAKLSDNRYLKNNYNEQYLGPAEQLLSKEKHFDILSKTFNKISHTVGNAGFALPSKKFYLKSKNYAIKTHWQSRHYVLWMFLVLWKLCTNFGESAIRAIFTLFVLVGLHLLILQPAPLKALEAIHINSGDYVLQSGLDYFYASFALVFSFDWKYLQPISMLGLLLLITKYFICALFASAILNLLIRKFTTT